MDGSSARVSPWGHSWRRGAPRDAHADLTPREAPAARGHREEGGHAWTAPGTLVRRSSGRRGRRRGEPGGGTGLPRGWGGRGGPPVCGFGLGGNGLGGVWDRGYECGPRGVEDAAHGLQAFPGETLLDVAPHRPGRRQLVGALPVLDVPLPESPDDPPDVRPRRPALPGDGVDTPTLGSTPATPRRPWPRSRGRRPRGVSAPTTPSS